jgi:hypothetical protein
MDKEYFELSPSDFQSSQSSEYTQSSTQYSDSSSTVSQNGQSYDTYNRDDNYHDHSSFTESERSSNANPFFSSYQLSTDTPLSSQDFFRDRIHDSQASNNTVYYTAHESESSLYSWKDYGPPRSANFHSTGVIRSSTFAFESGDNYGQPGFNDDDHISSSQPSYTGYGADSTSKSETHDENYNYYDNEQNEY